MNESILKGKWNQMMGSIKKRWGEITDDDLDMIEGDAQKLAGIIQEKYGKSKEEAEEEVREFEREQQ
ncbi:CsbD family protein [Anoxynatronum sibiricum]|uniref:CsbD family protein n=1 Tax=Anoxynatronum sibiricum TaxID=210623 RepID=A0ABU9VNY8_9CLOT